MTLADIQSQLENILGQQDILAHTSEVDDLKATFNKLIEAEDAGHPAAHSAEHSAEQDTENEENKTDDSENEPEVSVVNEPAEKIRGLFKDFSAKKTELLKAIKQEEKDNLSKKQALLEELRDLIQNEENLKVAFEKIKDIRDRWKEIGNIPRDAYSDIQNEYSKLNETFNYNINIYKELKEHDLKRNFSLKNQIVHQINDLKSIKDIRTVEKELARLRNEWDEIGGTYKDKWEIIKDKYWENVKAIYQRISEHYEDRRKEHGQNLEAKRALIPRLQKIVQRNLENVKDWNKATDAIKAIQDEWKEIGFSPRKDTQPVWEEFRSICNDFFDQKQEFFSEKKDEYGDNKNRKTDLIKRANELKTSKDWRNTSQEFVKLQKAWKKIGHAGPKLEHKLWKEFRGACDEFFNSRDNHQKEIESAFEENIQKKEDFISGLEKVELGSDMDEILKNLAEIGAQFNALGDVPGAKRKQITSRYQKTIQNKINDLKIAEEEKPVLLFKARIQALKDSNDEDALVEEKRRLKRDLNKTQEEIIQMENNLGFFSVSKGSEGLLADVNSKLENEKEKQQRLKEQIKIINIALR